MLAARIWTNLSIPGDKLAAKQTVKDEKPYLLHLLAVTRKRVGCKAGQKLHSLPCTIQHNVQQLCRWIPPGTQASDSLANGSKGWTTVCIWLNKTS